jgi:hypothetical protein
MMMNSVFILLLLTFFVANSLSFMNATIAYATGCIDSYVCNNERRQKEANLFMSEEPWSTAVADTLMRKLRSKKARFFGDSLAWQFASAVRCLTSEIVPPMTVEHHPILTMPLLQPHIERYLEYYLADGTTDIAVFSVGMWYNFDADELESASFARANAELTDEIIQEYCPQHASWMRDVSSVVPPNQFSPFQLGYGRRHCLNTSSVALGAQSYLSDLLRLGFAIGNWSAARRARGERVPLFAWKDVAPQHCKGSPDLQYDWRWGYAEHGEVHVEVDENPLPATSFKRNLVSKIAFSRSFKFDMILETWTLDVSEQQLHVDGDCTHYCNPSRITWRWASLFVEKFASII